jgi:hypothetical protein
MRALLEMDMQILIEFLSLRPVFTRKALYGIWYFYLLATVLQLGQYVAILFSTREIYSAGLSPHYYVSLVPPLLFAVAHLALVRIFLEMALQFIDKRSLSV